MLKLIKQIRFTHLFWGLFYFFIFGLLLRNSFNYLDPDLGWHLQVGRSIIQTGAVPDLNQYNYTFTGHWVDFEWLSNVGVYWIYSHFGYVAVNIVYALLIVIVLIILNIAVHRLYPRAGIFLPAILQILGVIASLPHLGVRIQEVGWLFLALLLLIIDYYDRRDDWRSLLFIPILMYLWACLHASFLIGFFLLGAWMVIKLGEKLLARLWPRPWLELSKLASSKKIIVLGGVTVVAWLATCLTPYYYKLYAFLIGYQQNTFYQTHIQEWLSQFSLPFQYWQVFYLDIVVLALLAYVYYALSREKYFKINLWTLFVAVLFVILSFKSRRHFPLLFVATFIFIVEVYLTVFQNLFAGLRRPQPSGGWLLWVKFCLLACLLLVAVSELVQTRFITDPFSSFCGDYPCGAVKFLQQHPEYDSWHLFNDYGWGGFLIWTDPSRLLFIDGRLPQVAFAGHTFLEEYLDFFNKKTLWPAKLEQYQIKLILLPVKDKQINVKNWERIVFGLNDRDLQTINYLRQYLNTAPGWRIIYIDNTAVIYGQR